MVDTRLIMLKRGVLATYLTAAPFSPLHQVLCCAAVSEAMTTAKEAYL
jgi:hypothetical protein